MPRIPIITAEGRAAVQQFPAQAPVQDYTGAYNFGQNLSEFSHQLNQITHTLKKQQDDIAVSELVGIFHGKLKENEIAVRTEDPLDQAPKFAENMGKVQKELMAQAKNRNVAAGISEYINKHLPLATATVHGAAIKYMGEEAIAKVDAMAPAVSKMAAEAANPAERNQIIDYYLNDITGLVNTRTLTPVEGQNKKEHFRVRAEVDFARHLSREDYEAFKYQDEKGEFANVPVRDLDTIRKQAESVELEKYKVAEKALEVAVKNHHAGVMRYLINKRDDGTLDKADILDWKDILHPTELEHMNEEYRKMALGINTGDVKAQVDTQEDYRDRTLDLDAREKSVHWLRRRSLIDQAEYTHRLSYLDGERNRRDSQARADQNSAEAKLTALQNKRDGNVRDRLNDLFKVTGPFEQFNFAMATVREQVFVKYDQLSIANGGGKYDPEAAYRLVKSEFLPLVPARLNPLIESLRNQLKLYPTKKSLQAAEATMSPYEFNTLILKQRELYAMEAYIEVAMKEGKLAPPMKESTR